jgi:hypothetical protein
MIYAIGGARFAQHPRPEVCLSSQVGSNELYGDNPIDEDVTRAVHDAHTTLSDTRLEAVSTGDNAPEHRIGGL